VDGDLRWYHQERPHDLFDHDFQNPPIVITATIKGKKQRAVLGSGKTGTVVALDAESGDLLWRTLVGVHQNDDVTEIPEDGLEVLPGDLGGVETTPAYADGVVYVPVVNWGRKYFPDSLGDLIGAPTGELVAIRVEDGEILWTAPLDNANFGAATVVNDLVFTSTADGYVYAFARADGKQVWRYLAPMGINAPLAVAGDKLLIPAGTGIGEPSLVALQLK
jgi:outer membrane protein assembly factor BamB